MKKIWAIAAVTAAISMGCSDGKDEPRPCSSNERTCSENRAEVGVCMDGEFVFTKCGLGTICSTRMGRCVECEDDAQVPMCSGDAAHLNSVKYCTDGIWHYTDCGVGRKCTVPSSSDGLVLGAFCQQDGSSQVAACTVGEKRCTTTGQAQVCGSDAQWGTAVACTNGTTCQQGECKAGIQCNTGEVQCSGSAVQRCVAGQWSTIETCGAEQKCNVSQGKCIDKGALPSAGSSCEESGTFVCGDDEVLYCNKSLKYEVARQCNGIECHELAEYSIADCLGTCEKAQDGYFVDYDKSCNQGYFELISCNKNDDGTYTKFGFDYGDGVCADDNTKLACSGSSVVTSACEGCKTSYDESTHVYSATCGGSGGSSSGTASATGHLRCTQYDSYCAQSGNKACIYPSGTNADDYGYCADKCSKAGDKLVECAETAAGGYAVFTDVCEDVGGVMVYATDYSKTLKCNNGCDSSGKACK